MQEYSITKGMRDKYREAIRKLDYDVREIEQIHEEMDSYLYDIERRINKLRNSRRG